MDDKTQGSPSTGPDAWREADSNRRHLDFQSSALPAELSRRDPRSYRLQAPWG
jgi:hypothetical protein